MTNALVKRRGQRRGELTAKTEHALATKARIHAIVSQVIDELEKRRARGKSDYVAILANELEAGGLNAWRALRDLLPKDDPDPAGNRPINFGAFFVNAAIEASRRTTDAAPPPIDLTSNVLGQLASLPAGAAGRESDDLEETNAEPNAGDGAALERGTPAIVLVEVPTTEAEPVDW
jgi:hypothetical protein